MSQPTIEPTAGRLLIVDPFEFARRGAALDGELDALLMGRVADSVEPVAGQSLCYTVRGWMRDDKSFLGLTIRGTLVLVCQRCLERMEFALDDEATLLLVPTGQDLPDEALEDDDFDPVSAGRDFDLGSALEDEVLLALPYAPAHAQCALPAADKLQGKDSPFAVLAKMKQGPAKGD